MYVPFLTLLSEITNVTNSQERVTTTTLHIRLCITKTVKHLDKVVLLQIILPQV